MIMRYIANIAQYIPQARDQFIESIKGKAVSAMAELDGEIRVVIQEGDLTPEQGEFLQDLSKKQA